MFRGLRPRLTFANVTSLLALFIALGGTGAYAVSQLKGSAIKKRSIPGNRLKTNSVGTKEVSNLLAKDFKAGQLPAGAEGPQGLQGPQGLDGPQGPIGPPGPTTGASTGLNTPTATPNSPNGWGTTQITTPTAGSVFVLASIRAGQACSASGSCSTDWGVYLDGAPVPGSRQRVSAAASATQLDDVTLAGIMPSVAAGSHTLTIEANDNPNVLSTQAQDRSLTGIALGG